MIFLLFSTEYNRKGMDLTGQKTDLDHHHRNFTIDPPGFGIVVN